jgi:integrase
MLHGHLRPGYDYLLDRKLTVILREAAASPLGADLARFLAGAEALGYSVRARTGMASEVAIRVLIQARRALAELTDADFTDFGQAITEREARLGRALKHYHHALYASRAVIYHLGAPAEPVPKRSTLGRWSWERHLEGVSPQVRRPMVAYLERLQGTHARSSVQGTASELAHFGRFLARHDPGLPSLALLDRQRHIEPYLNEVAAAVNRRTGAPIAASTAKARIQAVGSFLDAIAEWDWPEAPARRLVFPRDAPKLPHPLPRYLPPDAERALLRALEDSPNRLRADALLLMRATGMRIGELTDLELDCVHEVPSSGDWLKIPLGKLLTERMVPIDEETLALIDRIAAHRSPGRPLRHPRTGKLADFLLTHQGRRISADTLRDELRRAAAEAGLDGVVPHQLRHTYATALEIGRIASDATFPRKCDHGATGDTGRSHSQAEGARDRETAGQDRTRTPTCVRRVDVASDLVAPRDNLMRPPQRQRRSDEGRRRQRSVVTLTHSARWQQCSLPVSTPAARCRP